MFCVCLLTSSQGSFGGARVFLNLEQNTDQVWRAPRLPGLLRTEKQETGLEGFQVIIIVSALQSPVRTALTIAISLMSSKLGLTEDVEQDG